MLQLRRNAPAPHSLPELRSLQGTGSNRHRTRKEEINWAATTDFSLVEQFNQGKNTASPLPESKGGCCQIRRIPMPMNQVAYIFPGQGSQFVGMGRELAAAFPAARDIFDRADETLKISLSRIAWEGPEAELNDTINTQPALFVHSMAALAVLQELHPVCVAGHSMGELSALTACSALNFEDGLKLVRARGELMKKAGEISPGSMAAILGLDIPTLEEICRQASAEGEIVQVANDNCPGQVVISGASQAITRAITLANQAGARRAIALAVSIAAHSPLMIHAQEDFNRAVASAPIQDPKLPLVGNVTAEPLTTALQLRQDLQAQLTSRVRWTESVRRMSEIGVQMFLELGSGSVLGGLIKRIDRNLETIPLGTPDDFTQLSTRD
jgi:[acyl-carrier-protein] S-malonyltransferase